MLKKSLTGLLSAAIAVSPMTASASDGLFTVRVPVETVAFVPSTTTYDFGKVLVGQTPQRVMTFTNQSSEPVVIEAVEGLYGGQVMRTDCAGSLATARSCSLTVALPVTKKGPNQGEVRVRHSGTEVADVYVLKATGVSGDGLVSAAPSLLDFGSTSLRKAVGPKMLTLKNEGDSGVDLLDIDMVEGRATFNVGDHECYYLEPGETCDVPITFNASVQGLSQGRVGVTTGDGTLVRVATVAGQVTSGTPLWVSGNLTFFDVAVGQPSEARTATLRNVGKGPLGISRLSIMGDPSFEMVSNTCSASLAPDETCTAQVRVTPPDALQRTANLRLESTNSTTATSDLQMLSRPVADRAALTVEPTALDFGALPTGTTKSMDLTLRSTGTTPVTVSSHNITGVSAADFKVLNAANCTGALAPGMQCVLKVAVTPSVTGARTAALAFTSNATDATPAVSLSAQGLTGTLAATPGRLDFGTVEVGQSARLTSVLSNEGGAPLSIGAIEPVSAGSGAYGFSGCEGATLAPAQSCTLTVTFTPTAAGSAEGGVTVKNSGTPEVLRLSFTGQGKAPALPLASMGAFDCPANAQVGVAQTCTASLSNIGTVALSVGSPLTRTGTAFAQPTSNCAATLAPGEKCTVSVSGTFAAAGVQSTTVTVPTSAGNQSSVANVTVRAPEVALTTLAHDIARATETNRQTHTLKNTGLFPVNLTLPAQVATSARPTGSVAPAGFSMVSSTCSATLAAGMSCTITTQFAPDKAGAYTGTLSVNASAFGWSTQASGSLSGTASAAPDTTMWLEANPNPVDWGKVSSLATSAVTRTVTLTNRSTSTAASNLKFTLAGPNAAETSLVSHTCGSSIAVSGSCTVTVGFLPRGGAREQHSAELRVTSALPELVVPLVLQTAVGELTPSTTTLDFGAVKIGTSKTLPVTFTNTGNAAVALGTGSGSTLATLLGTGAARFTVAAGTCPATLNEGGTCVVNVTFTPNALPAITATLSQAHMGYRSPSTVALTASGLPADVPGASISAFTCTSPLQPGMAYSCSATITSTGTAPLSVSAATRTNATFGAPVLSGCSSSMAPGARCTVTMSGTAPKAGTYDTSVSVTTNLASGLAQNAKLVVSGANVTLTMRDHGQVQVASSADAVHVLTNHGPGALSLGSVLPSVSGAPFSYVSRTCGSTLAAGASCNITTRCTPTAALTGVRTATLTVPSTYESFQGNLSCDGRAPSVAVTPAGPLTQNAGGHSRSGNWYRVQNTGAGPVTIKGMLTQSTNWTLTGDSTQPTQCAVNKTLAAGAECLVLETLAVGIPGSSAKSRQIVQSTAGDSAWDSEIMSFGVSVQAQTPFAPATVNQTGQAKFLVTNLAPYRLSSLSATSTGNFKVEPLGCTVLERAGAAGSSCVVTVTGLPVATAGVTTGQLNIQGMYPQVLNRVEQLPVSSGVQGSFGLTRTISALNLVWETGTYPLTAAGGSNDTVSYLHNRGQADVKFTAAGNIKTGTAHSLLSTTCQGVLAAGTSCEYRTRFAPTYNSVNSTTLNAPLETGLSTATLNGQLMPVSDVSVTVSDSVQVAYAPGESTFAMTVRNPGRAVANVLLNFGDTTSGASKVTQRSVATCTVSAGGTCTVSGGQATIVMPVDGIATVRQTLTYGGGDGAVTMSARIAVSDVSDTNEANNQASDSTDIVSGVSPWPAGTLNCPQYGSVTPDLKFQCHHIINTGGLNYQLHDPYNTPNSQASFNFPLLPHTTRAAVWYTVTGKVATNGTRYLVVPEQPQMSPYDPTLLVAQGRLNVLKFNAAGTLINRFDFGGYGKAFVADIDSARGRLYVVADAGYAGAIMRVYDLNSGTLLKSIPPSHFAPGKMELHFRVDEVSGDLVWFGRTGSGNAQNVVYRMNPVTEQVSSRQFADPVLRAAPRPDRFVVHGNRAFVLDNIPGGDTKYQLRRINLTTGESKIVFEELGHTGGFIGDTMYFGQNAAYLTRKQLMLRWN